MPKPYYPAPPKAPARNKYLRLLAMTVGQRANTLTCPQATHLEGKTVLVTGASSGIGLEIAREAAARRATVISAQRRQVAMPNVEPVLLDLSSPAKVAATVEALKGRQIDILFANAGHWPQKGQKSPEGHETAFAINCLGHHALIRGLQENGVLSDTARIILTSSDMYVLADNCTSDFSGSAAQAYARSKLGNMWQMAELTRRSPDLSVHAVHPGAVATNLIGDTFFKAMMIPASMGAQASLIAATQPLPKGSYFHNLRGETALAASDIALDTQKAALFWERLEALR